MAQHYIPRNSRKTFGARSEQDATRITEQAFLLSQRIAQYKGLKNASNDAMMRNNTAHSMANDFASRVRNGNKTKAEAYYETMSRLSGGTSNEFGYLFGVDRNAPGLESQDDKSRLDAIANNLDKYNANTTSVRWAANFSKQVEGDLGGGDPLARAEAALEELERNPGPYESVDKGVYVEAALFNVSYEDYVSGKEQARYEDQSSRLVDGVVSDIGRRAHSIMEKDYALREYDINKSIAIDQNPNWESQYPEAEQGERSLSLTDQDKFELWKSNLREVSPRRVELLDDSLLKDEYNFSEISPDQEQLEIVRERNNAVLEDRFLDQRVANERDRLLTDEQKRAEFPLVHGTPEYTALRATHDAIVKRKLLEEIERDRQKNLEEEDRLEAQAQVAEEMAGPDQPEVATEEAPEAGAPSDKEVSESDNSDGAKGEDKAQGKDEVEKEAPLNEDPQIEGEAVKADVEKDTSGQSLFLSNLEKQKEVEQSQDVVAEVPNLKDLTPEEKEANELLKIKGKDVGKDLASLRSMQEKTMILDYLQNSPEGQEEFDAYVAARAGRLKENTGLKGGKLYSKMSAVMMQMSAEELKEEFPESTRALEEERNNLDVSEEVQFYKENINPDLTEEQEARVVSDFQFQKQADTRLGPPDKGTLLGRLKEVAKGYRNEDGSLKKGKIASSALTALGAGLAVMSGPAGVAAFIGNKVAMHYISKATSATKGVDNSVADTLTKTGHISKEEVEFERATQLVKAKEKRWPKLLTAVALVGVGAVLTGSVDFDQAKDSFATLASEGKELLKSLSDSAYAMLSGAEAAAPVVSEEAIEAAMSVAEGVDTSEVSAEAIQSAMDVSGMSESVTHTVQSGDTMSQIAYDYLSDRGINVTASDLYGPDGILEQTGMNIDLIHVGEEVDLTQLEAYVQAHEAGVDFVPDSVTSEISQSTPSEPSASPEAGTSPDSNAFNLEDAKQQISEQIIAMGPEGGSVKIDMPNGQTFSMEVGPEMLASDLLNSANMTNFMNEVAAMDKGQFVEQVNAGLSELGEGAGSVQVDMGGGQIADVELGPVVTAGELLNPTSQSDFMDEMAAMDKDQFEREVSAGINELGKEGGTIQIDMGGGQIAEVEVGPEVQFDSSKEDLFASLNEDNHYNPDEGSGPSGP